MFWGWWGSTSCLLTCCPHLLPLPLRFPQHVACVQKQRHHQASPRSIPPLTLLHPANAGPSTSLQNITSFRHNKYAPAARAFEVEGSEPVGMDNRDSSAAYSPEANVSGSNCGLGHSAPANCGSAATQTSGFTSNVEVRQCHQDSNDTHQAAGASAASYRSANDVCMAEARGVELDEKAAKAPEILKERLNSLYRENQALKASIADFKICVAIKDQAIATAQEQLARQKQETVLWKSYAKGLQQRMGMAEAESTDPKERERQHSTESGGSERNPQEQPMHDSAGTEYWKRHAWNLHQRISELEFELAQCNAAGGQAGGNPAGGGQDQVVHHINNYYYNSAPPGTQSM
ncbi:hypothetical protein FN846DRAFT_889938 [Sphaerosporella brunnea]|uniref:Uncharacterized protein n=1 Tax=Sphaerosporella brunnea TaxID=1250544 RepID=A0A5J5EY57_9PEZI|nr:hypothetical protein FN846DRAFT_889938 [Sphaerosporella brunnea]